MATGKDLNKTFLKLIDEKRESILNAGLLESTLSGNVTDVSGNNTAFVVNDDMDTYRAINDLKNYLEFSSFHPDHTYDICGVGYVEDGKGKNTSLMIRDEDIAKIADHADDYERLLGIKFPAQIHQMKSKYANSVITGTSVAYPRPKLMSESTQQYEDYLESVYASANIPKKDNIDGIGRQPYPHEQIDFRVDDKQNPAFASEYYLHRYTEERKKAMGANNRGQAQNNRINSGDRLTINESDDVENTPLGRKVGSALNSFDTFFKNESMWRKVRIGAIGCLGGAGLIAVAMANPALSAGVLVGGGVISLAAFAGFKLKDAFNKKVHDWLYGPELPKQEPKQESESRAPQPPAQAPVPPVQPTAPTGTPVPPVQPAASTGTPVPPVQRPSAPAPQKPTIIPEQLDNFLNEAGINMEQYRDIERRVLVAKSELASLDPSSPDFQTKTSEVAELKRQQKDQLMVIEGLMDEMLRDFNVQKNEGRGLA